MFDIDHWKQRAEAAEAQLADCTRSHPHENMTKTCELRTEIARLANHLATAEAKLKALYEQEAAGWFYCGDRDSVLHYTQADANDLDNHLIALYSAPVPPVDVQELQRRLKDAVAENECLSASCKAASSSIVELERILEARIEAQHTLAVRAHDYEQNIAELGRKLAEQQASRDSCHNYCGDDYCALLAQAREEGRKEAVPEGWQVVPLRDYFAAKAMQGELASPSLKWDDETLSSVAHNAYVFADHMLKAREQP